MRPLQHGFTLIELMITVAIIGILAAVALPAYNDYTIRAKLSEAIIAMAACRVSITEVYQSGGTPPAPNGWGCETSVSRYVASITTDTDGVVTATVRNISSNVDTKMLSLTPYINGVAADSATQMGVGVNEWRCGPALANGVGLQYMPGSCRGV